MTAVRVPSEVYMHGAIVLVALTEGGYNAYVDVNLMNAALGMANLPTSAIDRAVAAAMLALADARAGGLTISPQKVLTR